MSKLDIKLIRIAMEELELQREAALTLAEVAEIDKEIHRLKALERKHND